MLKKAICKICNIFNFPRFSQPLEVKIPKCEFLEVKPTKKFQKFMNKQIKNMDLNHIKVYVNGTRVQNVKSNIEYNNSHF